MPRQKVKVYVRHTLSGRMVETTKALRRPKGGGWTVADLTKSSYIGPAAVKKIVPKEDA